MYKPYSGKSNDTRSTGTIRNVNEISTFKYLRRTGLIYKENEEFEIAEAFLKKALITNPEFVAAHMALEALYSSMGMFGDAYRHAEIHRRNLVPFNN